MAVLFVVVDVLTTTFMRRVGDGVADAAALYRLTDLWETKHAKKMNILKQFVFGFKMVNFPINFV